MLVTDDDRVKRRIDDRSLSRIAGAELNGARLPPSESERSCGAVTAGAGRWYRGPAEMVGTDAFSRLTAAHAQMMSAICSRSNRQDLGQPQGRRAGSTDPQGQKAR